MQLLLDHVKPLGCQHRDPTAWTVQLHEEAVCGESVQHTVRAPTTSLQLVSGAAASKSRVQVSFSSSLSDWVVSAYFTSTPCGMSVHAMALVKMALYSRNKFKKADMIARVRPKACLLTHTGVQEQRKASPGAQRPPPCCSTMVTSVFTVSTQQKPKISRTLVH